MQDFSVQRFANHMISGKRVLRKFHCLVNEVCVRAMDYHDKHACNIDRFYAEEQDVSLTAAMDVDVFSTKRKWRKEKPGLIPAIFEGWRTRYHVMSRALDAYGFAGRLYVPGLFLNVSTEKQTAFVPGRRMCLSAGPDYAGSRDAVDWDKCWIWPGGT